MQFSNHTGYDVCKGEVLQGEQLLTLVSVGTNYAWPRATLPSLPSPSCVVRFIRRASHCMQPHKQGLEANGLLKGYTHLLTGYIGSPSFLKAVVEVAHKLKVASTFIKSID